MSSGSSEPAADQLALLPPPPVGRGRPSRPKTRHPVAVALAVSTLILFIPVVLIGIVVSLSTHAPTNAWPLRADFEESGAILPATPSGLNASIERGRLVLTATTPGAQLARLPTPEPVLAPNDGIVVDIDVAAPSELVAAGPACVGDRTYAFTISEGTRFALHRIDPDGTARILSEKVQPEAAGSGTPRLRITCEPLPGGGAAVSGWLLTDRDVAPASWVLNTEDRSGDDRSTGFTAVSIAVSATDPPGVAVVDDLEATPRRSNADDQASLAIGILIVLITPLSLGAVVAIRARKRDSWGALALWGVLAIVAPVDGALLASMLTNSGWAAIAFLLYLVVPLVALMRGPRTRLRA